MKKYIIIFLFFLSGLSGLFLSLYLHHDFFLIVRPPLQVYHYPMQFLTPLKNDRQAGKKIFREYCASCHAVHPLIEVNAPRIGDKAAWQLRRQRGLSLLFHHTLEGVGAMPARGGCFECSDGQLRRAIRYILTQIE
ncbi:MAG: Cytochrome c5 [Gammaproteobacteria bacterium]|jgi:cytochrome c5|nr:Cytochrome c5 [Gammaproteobacteria bacterium]